MGGWITVGAFALAFSLGLRRLAVASWDCCSGGQSEVAGADWWGCFLAVALLVLVLAAGW